MSWRLAGRNLSDSLNRFLRLNEWRQTNLSSRIFLAGEKPRLGQIAEGRLWVDAEGSRIQGALYISRYGVVLPAYNPENNDERSRVFLRKLLLARRDRLFSIIGTADRVDDLEDLLGETSCDFQSYRLLTVDSKLIKRITRLSNTSSMEVPGLSFHSADIKDFDKLWPLEKAYQLEEVLREGSVLNEPAGRRHFQETLRNQMVFYASLNDRPVAKAGTNARGWNWDQVGGVFVVPDFRGRGYGRAVMERLLSAIADAGKNTCLFVKDNNPSALGLYRSLGFVDREQFRIAYWGR